MPSKNVVKTYKKNAYYHIYNRGVDKRIIFSDKDDYQRFLGYLKFYLTPIDLQGQTLKVPPSRKSNNFSETMKLLAYCLMPNHFHLLVYQTEPLSIANFMHSILTKYSISYNKKVKRTGPLFEGRYKAVRVTSGGQLVYLTKYIHRNPINILPTRTDLEGYKYSSYGNYLKKFSQLWIKPDEILENFKNSSYKEFVEKVDDKDVLFIKEIGIDVDLPTRTDLES